MAEALGEEERAGGRGVRPALPGTQKRERPKVTWDALESRRRLIASGLDYVPPSSTLHVYYLDLKPPMPGALGDTLPSTAALKAG